MSRRRQMTTPYPGTEAFLPSFATDRAGMRRLYEVLAPIFSDELDRWGQEQAERLFLIEQQYRQGVRIKTLQRRYGFRRWMIRFFDGRMERKIMYYTIVKHRILLDLCRKVFEACLRQRIRMVTLLGASVTTSHHWVTLRVNQWYLRACVEYRPTTQRRRSFAYVSHVYYDGVTMDDSDEGDTP